MRRFSYSRYRRKRARRFRRCRALSGRTAEPDAVDRRALFPGEGRDRGGGGSYRAAFNLMPDRVLVPRGKGRVQRALDRGTGSGAATVGSASCAIEAVTFACGDGRLNFHGTR
jgi:hypothetical protein